MVYIRLTSETDTILPRLQNSVIEESGFIIARKPIQLKSYLFRKPIQIVTETVAEKLNMER